MSAARSARLATSWSCASVLDSWVPKISTFVIPHLESTVRDGKGNPYRPVPSLTVSYRPVFSRDERDSQPACPPRRRVTNPTLILKGPAERSVRYGSRGPSRASRPDRARNKSPHHVVGTGW